jgi:glycerophosphoryl diester phosphodiesterase
VSRNHLAEVIGHRGAPRAYVENTVASFLCAIESGADAIELDVHATADGAVVVHHDPRLDFTHLGRKVGPAIADLTLSEIEEYGRSRSEPIPTLAQVLSLVGGRAKTYVEIKSPNIERLVVDVIHHGSASCAVHSFDHRASLRVRELASGLPTGILLTSYLVDPEHALIASHASDLWQQWEMIDQALVERAHAAKARVIAWTVNDVGAAKHLVALGVDGICTDVPADMERALAA